MDDEIRHLWGASSLKPDDNPTARAQIRPPAGNVGTPTISNLEGGCDIVWIMGVPILPLNEMSVEEKLQTMEALWQSLSVDPEAIESPAWHEEELRERERKIESGEAKFIDWEKAKADIRHRTS